MNNWRDLNLFCEYCGRRLESKPNYASTIAIAGAEPMIHRHIGSGEISCGGYKARPYNCWGVREKYYDLNNRASIASPVD